jgi:hypothetical protein
MQVNLEQYLKYQHEPLNEAIKDLVRIPSVIEKGEAGFIFGRAVDDALRKTLTQ